MRLATTIALYAIGFAIWNVGTRPPLQLVRDIGNGFRNGSILRRGMFQFIGGVFAIGIGSFVMAPAIAHTHDEPVLASLTVLTALIVEQLVGPDLRARYR